MELYVSLKKDKLCNVLGSWKNRLIFAEDNLFIQYPIEPFPFPMRTPRDFWLTGQFAIKECVKKTGLFFNLRTSVRLKDSVCLYVVFAASRALIPKLKFCNEVSFKLYACGLIFFLCLFLKTNWGGTNIFFVFFILNIIFIVQFKL